MTNLRRPGTARGQSIWPMIFAPIVWALHFCLSYGTAAIWCAKRGGGEAGLQAVLLLLGLGALGLIALIGWRAWRQWDYTDDWDYDHAKANNENRREFLGHAGFLLALVSAVGVIYVTLPALLAGGCR